MIDGPTSPRENIQRSEERFRQLAERLTDHVIYVVDLMPHRIVYISPSYEKVWKLPVNSLYENPQSFIDRIHPEDRKKIQDTLILQHSGVETHVEYRLLFEDGTVRWVKDRTYPVTDSNGVCYRATGIVEDITVEKETEFALRSSECRYREAQEQLRLALESAQMGTWHIDLKTNEVRLSDHSLALIGEEIHGVKVSDSVREWFHPDDVEGNLRALEESVRNHTPYNHEYRIIRKDGSLRWIFSKGTPHYDNDGNPVSMSGVLLDITDRKQCAMEMERSRQELHDFFMQAPAPMVILEGPEHKITLANSLYDQLRQRSLVGMTLIEAFPAGEIANFIPILDQVYRTGVPFVGKEQPVQLPDENGVLQKSWLDIGYCPFKDNDGKVKGIFALVHDVTAQVEARNKLEESQEQLKLALEAGLVGTWKVDLESQQLTSSPEHATILGIEAQKYDLHELIKKVVHPEDQEAAHQAWQSAVQGLSRFFYEYRIVRPDGSIRWVETRGETRFDSRGQPHSLLGVIADVTERKHCDDQFRAMTEVAPQFVWTADEKGQVTYANTSLTEYMGTETNDALGSGWRDHIHPEDMERAAQEWQQALETGTPLENECRIRSKSGKYAWFLNRAIPIRHNGSARISRWVGISVDITERKRTEDDLRQTTEILNAIMTSSQDVIYVKDRQSRLLYCNPTALRLMGRSESEIYGRNDIEFFGTCNREVIENDQRVITTGIGESVVEWVCWPDGSKRLYMSSKEPHLNENGDVVGVVGISRDITDLAKAQSRLQTIFDTLPVFGGFLDSTGVTMMVNQKAVDASEQTKEDIIGKFFWDCSWWNFSVEVRDRLKKAIMEASAGVPQRYDTECMATRNGRQVVRHVDLSLIPVRSEKGRVQEIVATGFDITERIEQERAILAAKEEAEKANLSKNAFLANMSHEIRTPMTAVLGFTEILRDMDLNDKQRQDALNRIDRSGRGLLRLIDDILDISKVEAGKFSTEKSRFSPLEIVTEVTALLRLHAEQKNLKLKTKILPSAPAIAYSDQARVRQILTNLIGNAIKFTQKGEVVIEVGSEADSQRDYLIFEVIDTGIGIAECDRKKLFQPFAQADDSISRKFGGTGLGLVLSRRLCQQLGGDLVLLESHMNQGSRFLAKIEAGPFEKIATESLEGPVEGSDPIEDFEEEIEGQPIRYARILVADDSPDNQLLMRTFLESAGAQVDVADNGEQAVVKAMTHDYDVVLMDIQMPLVDGIQATERLRASGYRRPILALTAHAMREELVRCIAAGCDEHVAKPVTKRGIVSAVRKHVGSLS